MKAPLSILGTASQASGNSSSPETFYFSGSDFGNVNDWYMNDLALGGEDIYATRVPGPGDDVVITVIPDVAPSLPERTYKSIVFRATASCYNSGVATPFYKSQVKFITSSGDITGAPTCLIADLESAAGISFTNSVSLDTAANILAGNWVAAGNIVLERYYHANEADISPGSPNMSSVQCQNYNASGAVGIHIPGDEAFAALASVTITITADAGAQLAVDRCTDLTLTNTLPYFAFQFGLDGSPIANVDLNSSGNVIAFYGYPGTINVNSGTVSDESTAIGGNVNFLDGVVINGISCESGTNLYFVTEAQYIAARQLPAYMPSSGVGTIYIGGYEHQKFTLSGGPLATGSYDILVYNGSRYGLYDQADSFNYVGELTYTGTWDITLGGPVEGYWESGSPPLMSGWAGGSGEPTWGTE